MTTSVLVLRHLAFEDLGVFASELAERDFRVTYLDVGVDPVDAEAIVGADILVVLGGPIGVGDVAVFPYLREEIAAIRARLTLRRRTLGICLGAQLIAAALGGRVYPSPGGVEIGYGPLDLTAAGARGPLGELAGSPVLHWHGAPLTSRQARNSSPPRPPAPIRRSRLTTTCLRRNSTWRRTRPGSSNG